MSTLKIGSLSGAALILSGVSLALWPLTHPWGSVAGAEIGRSGQWMVSHTFHFLAALFGLIGLLGLVDREVRAAGSLERLGFFLAFTGTILFAGTGIFTAFVWPIIARDAPALAEVQGPFFSPPHPVILITAILYSFGYILLGIALLRSRTLPSWGALALIAGAVLLLLPPPPLSPLPWALFLGGGVLFGLGLASLGLAVQRGLSPV